MSTDHEHEWPFGAWIKARRARLDLTQERLAERVGCAVQTIRAFEHEARRPSRLMAARLADALEIPAADSARFLQLARGIGADQGHPPPTLAGVEPAYDRRPAIPPPAIPTVELIGRAAERAELQQRMRAAGQRLITLVGAGGIGKTSLALHVAAAMVAEDTPSFRDGVALALLAPIATASGVPLAIADALGLSLQGARPVIDQLADALRDRSMLLVLDNLEHLLVPGEGDTLTALIRRILAEAPGVRILATSRERLRMRDEWVIELGGLALPTADSGPRVDQSDAVRLFVERAQRAAPSFTINAESRPAIARICRLLEGMPLAIELAAAWAYVLAPREIAAEVERALDFLTLTDRDAPTRHRSMRAALDHSWQLLDDDERRTLAGLAVFRGGCDRDAAMAVLGAAQNSSALIARLATLIDKSLLQRAEIGGAAHYVLHELVRQYAAERLAADPDEQRAAERRHTAYYAGLLQRAIDGRTGTSTAAGRATLDQNIDNLRAAWARAAAAADAAALATMARGMFILYEHHGWLLDAPALYSLAVEGLRDAGPDAAVVRGQLLGLQGYFLLRIGNLVEARPRLEESLATMRAAGAPPSSDDPTRYLGMIALRQGRFAEAHALFAEAAGQAQASGDLFMQLWAEIQLATLYEFMGDYGAAERQILGCLAGWRGQGYSRGEALCLAQLGQTFRLTGRLDEAEAHLREALPIAVAARDFWVVSICLIVLGAVASQRGDLDEAFYLLAESVEGMREMGDMWLLGRALALLVRVEIGRGNPAAARRASTEIIQCARTGEELLVSEAAYSLALLLDREGDSNTALALLRIVQDTPGEHDTIQRAARLRAQIERRPSTARGATAAPAHCHDLLRWLEELCARPPAILDMPAGTPNEAGEGLSPREIEVLRLLVAGASNQVIADTLVISLHTAKHHVTSILQKLGVSSRAQAALRGRALGIEPHRPE